MILVDTNVLLDVLTDDPIWAEWSINQLDLAARRGPVMINAIIYSELSVRFQRMEDLDDILSEVGLECADIPRTALFLAGKVFQRYRAAGGNRQNVLPDFFIGAHAATVAIPLLTRDSRRYRTYFPAVTLIVPAL